MMNRIVKHLHSYKFAMKGIWLALRKEQNMFIHFVAAIVVVIANTWLNLSRTDWVLTLLLIGAVMGAEMFNTAIEMLANRITREQDELIGKAKDLAAGAVLIICIIAAVCAIFIYYPYLV